MTWLVTSDLLSYKINTVGTQPSLRNDLFPILRGPFVVLLCLSTGNVWTVSVKRLANNGTNYPKMTVIDFKRKGIMFMVYLLT